MNYIFIAQYHDWEEDIIYYIGTNLKDAFDKSYNSKYCDGVLSLTIYISGTAECIFDNSVVDNLDYLKYTKECSSRIEEYRDILDELELLIDEKIKELENLELLKQIKKMEDKQAKELEELHRLQEKYKDRMVNK